MNLLNTSFDDIFDISGVLGILVVSPEGKIFYQDITKLQQAKIKEADLELSSLLLDGVKEVDLLFGRYRIYIRKCPVGFLWVVLDPEAPAAMVRLQCDIITPKMTLKKQAKKGFGRLFR